MPRFFLLLIFLCAPGSALAEHHETASAPSGVVASAHPEATKAGEEMLRAGGSATDAAMAMMLALTVVEPQSSGIGGGGFLLHHDAASGVLETIDGRETAPREARADRFLDSDGNPLAFRDAAPGGLSVGVPGNMALMAKAHRKWGKLPWPRLFKPAIRLAEQGYAVTPPQYASMQWLAEIWRDFPAIRALYWRKGKPAPPGTIVRNPELAALLRDLASGGAEAFYSGETRAAIQRAVAGAGRNPANMSDADFENYAAIVRAPICAPYRQYRICGMGPPSSGATTVLQILGLLERFDLSATGPTDMRNWHLIGEAMRLAYADRDTYLGDADFVGVPVAGLVDRDYIARRSAMIAPDRALGDYRPGLPPGGGPRGEAPAPDERGTTHFATVDAAGNVVTMTSTVEGLFGSQLIARGMVLNNELTDFSFLPERDGAPVPNRVAPGKRPLSSMSPTIVYDESGRPVLTLGSAGGRRIIMHVAKTLIGVIDWGLPLQQAMALPNIYFNANGLIVEQNSALAESAKALSAFGSAVTVANIPSKLAGAQRTEQGWTGAVDPRGIGVATQIAD